MLLQLLHDLERQSRRRGIPIIGLEKGSWLLEKVRQLQPRRILELGTANGYSGIILGSEGAELTTIDLNSELGQEAEKNFGNFKTNARTITADAVEHTQKLAGNARNHGKFDLIFIDIAKSQYLPALEHCLKLVKVGGSIIADNITFTGCQDYKEAVLKHPQLRTEIISIKDGLSCSRRVK